MLIFVEGIDKTGKDTLVRYINELTNYKYCVMTRGPLSAAVYAEKFEREFDDSCLNVLKDSLIIYLTADTQDLDIRFKLTNEPEINKDEDKKLFDRVITFYTSKLCLKTIRVNTSVYTPYEIALKIKKYIEEEEKNAKDKQR